MRRKWGLIWL